MWIYLHCVFGVGVASAYSQAEMRVEEVLRSAQTPQRRLISMLH